MSQRLRVVAAYWSNDRCWLGVPFFITFLCVRIPKHTTTKLASRNDRHHSVVRYKTHFDTLNHLVMVCQCDRQIDRRTTEWPFSNSVVWRRALKTEEMAKRLNSSWVYLCVKVHCIAVCRRSDDMQGLDRTMAAIILRLLYYLGSLFRDLWSIINDSRFGLVLGLRCGSGSVLEII